MSILDEILDAKRQEVDALRPELARLEAEAHGAEKPRDFASALRAGDRLAVIAEIKRRSPSKGELAPDLDAAPTAKAYEAGGAAALSVLTDRDYFAGSLDDLREARQAVDRPVLRKDFTIDAVQVYEARAAGADAVLLIVKAIPDDGRLRALGELAESLGMAALVEVDDVPGLERAVDSGARVVGITNRNLHTFGEDLSTAEHLAGAFPDDVVSVAESAIRSPDDAARMASAGFDAILVGEALVRADDPTEAVRRLAVPRAGEGGRPTMQGA